MKNFIRHVLRNADAGAVSGGASAGASAGAMAGVAAGGTTTGTAAPASAGTAQAATTPTDWTTSFNDDSKGFVQNKGWKDPAQVVDSYRNLEKLLGAPQDQVIRLPKEDDAAGWDSVMTRLGRPATPDGYKLEVPKEGGDPAFAKWASEQFHKQGLNEKQGKALAEGWNQRLMESQAAQKEAYTAKVTQEQAALKKEWGAAHDQNQAIAQRAVREFGVDAKAIDAMESAIGLQATVKFFHSIGSRMGEAAFVGGNGRSGDGNGPMTPAQANSQINALRQDPGFVQKYVAGDAQARAKMEQLHRFAYPDA